MNKAFGKFLSKHQAEAEWNKYYIPTKKLGEWAWAKLDSQALGKMGFKLEMELKGESGVYLDIAIACLGKKELKRRLLSEKAKQTEGDSIESPSSKVVRGKVKK